MRKARFLSLMLAIALLNSGYSPADPPCAVDVGKPDSAKAEGVVRSYLAAVDRGELVTFGRTLTRSDITPVRVRYDYRIAGGDMETRVYSTLNDPMPVPDQPEYEVVGVCSAIENGRIVETESHVLLK